jgi:NADH:ubiquinone oxidoreductase subunit K
MTVILAILCSSALFGVFTHRTWLGLVMSLQLLLSVVVVALVALGRPEAGLIAETASRAQSLGLVVMVFSQLQALLALGFAVRLHYLRVRPNMAELRSMKN